jgi:hypothetical protein
MDRYDLSILQAEFSLTRIRDRAVSGRCFFDAFFKSPFGSSGIAF